MEPLEPDEEVEEEAAGVVAAALLPAESDPDPLSGPDPEPLSDPDPLSEPDEPESDFGEAGIVDSLEPEDEPPERLSVL